MYECMGFMHMPIQALNSFNTIVDCTSPRYLSVQTDTAGSTVARSSTLTLCTAGKRGVIVSTTRQSGPAQTQISTRHVDHDHEVWKVPNNPLQILLMSRLDLLKPMVQVSDRKSVV